MQTLILIAAAPALTEKGDKPPTVERNLLGQWYGAAACQGDVNFLVDGTFTWRHRGPGDASVAGSWAMKWDALPPTLVLTCKNSTDPDIVGKEWSFKVVELDEGRLACKWPAGGGTAQFSRAKK